MLVIDIIIDRDAIHSIEFQKEFEKHLPYLKSLCRKFSYRHYEDIAQVVCYKAIKYRNSFELGTNMKAWLSRIAMTTKLDYMENHMYNANREVSIDDDITKDRLNILSYNDKRDEVDIKITKAIKELPRCYRTLFIGHAIKELSYKELSKKYKVPMGTVMSRIFRARKILSKKLERFKGRISNGKEICN